MDAESAVSLYGLSLPLLRPLMLCSATDMFTDPIGGSAPGVALPALPLCIRAAVLALAAGARLVVDAEAAGPAGDAAAAATAPENPSPTAADALLSPADTQLPTGRCSTRTVAPALASSLLTGPSIALDASSDVAPPQPPLLCCFPPLKPRLMAAAYRSASPGSTLR